MIVSSELRRALRRDLREAFGESDLLLSWSSPTVYLDYEKAEASGIARSELDEVAAETLRSHPGIAEVYVVRDVVAKERRNDIEDKIVRSVHEEASGDLFVVPEPCWFPTGDPERTKASHGSPYPDDTHVPLVLYGEPFAAKTVDRGVRVVDLVPTLLAALGMDLPEELEGRPLAPVESTLP